MNAERLNAEARALPAHGGRAKRRRLKVEIEEALDELRAKGYEELPDGRWVNPDGHVVAGT